MEFNFDRAEQRGSLDPRMAEAGRNARALAGDHATPAGEGGRTGRFAKPKLLPIFQLDRLEARVLRTGPAARPVSSNLNQETPQLFLYGIDNSEPVYAWDPKKKMAVQNDAAGPSVPFRLREATLSLRPMTTEPIFNRISLGDPALGAATQQGYTD
mmetsp:Transcript_36994/g.115158  ORF Transcript_36994/g.115158 Transcript_36994/m.115158 type:complete len:156 (-) Transcript_36994:23-490(-)